MIQVLLAVVKLLKQDFRPRWKKSQLYGPLRQIQIPVTGLPDRPAKFQAEPEDIAAPGKPQDVEKLRSRNRLIGNPRDPPEKLPAFRPYLNISEIQRIGVLM